MRKLTFFLLIAIFLFNFSCEKKPTNPSSQKPTFTINGVVVKDMNSSKDIAYFTVQRNDTLFNAATVKVGSRAIPSIGSGSYYSDTMSFTAATPYRDSIISAQDTVTITFDFVLPGTFGAQISPPTDSIHRSSQSVLVIWTGSASDSGYFISVVKGDSIPGAQLYSATIPTSDGTQTQIPASAFESGPGVLVLGDYWVYVVSYNKSFVGYPGMPFVLPQGLRANNIAGANGTIGAGVIAPRVRVYVPPAR